MAAQHLKTFEVLSLAQQLRNNAYGGFWVEEQIMAQHLLAYSFRVFSLNITVILFVLELLNLKN